jgi:Tfp pilus assembly protein PilF
MQQLEEAKKDVDAALALDGKNADARHFSARIALTMGDIDRAEREVRIARELAPRDPRIGTTYAAILMGRKANREAIGVLGEVIHEYPNYLYARKLRATLYQYLGDCCSPGNYRVALEDYEYLIRHGAPDAGLLSQRAAMLISLGDPEPAISDLTTALVLQPDNQLLLKSRAEAYATVHRDALAVKDYDVLLAEAAPGVPLYAMLDEHRAKMLVGRAYSLVELKRFPEAVEDVVAAVSIGGKRSILRAQVLLRRHGFTDVPIDGQNSSTLRQALSSCFGLKACYQPVMREI